eukprot:707755-Prorocentrum_minimum.AAC.1
MFGETLYWRFEVRVVPERRSGRSPAPPHLELDLSRSVSKSPGFQWGAIEPPGFGLRSVGGTMPFLQPAFSGTNRGRGERIYP